MHNEHCRAKLGGSGQEMTQGEERQQSQREGCRGAENPMLHVNNMQNYAYACVFTLHCILTN